jgi:MoaA/NifB/PqqE/SkfB family radical SAM enzyme
MCDIWKGNNNTKELSEKDIRGMLDSFKELNTKSVVMSGGEALMHPDFFRLCEMLRLRNLKVTILSTGLLLKKYAEEIISKTNEVIVSLDGSREVHDRIRNIPHAFDKLKEGVREIKKTDKNFRITARSVIQKKNFDDLPNIIEAAHEIGIDQISFLTADVSTNAFNRQGGWGAQEIDEVRLSFEELKRFNDRIETLFRTHSKDFDNKFIAESPEKFRRFYEYYAAFHGLCEFPEIKCNAPWVSAVVEADGSVRPCFFHDVSGNINEKSLIQILNSESSISFRRNLDVTINPICEKCVCSLNLSPLARL